MASSLQVKPRSFTIGTAIQKLLDEVGLSLLDAANKSEWHNITRPEALAAHWQARAASGFSAQVAAAKRPSAVTKGAASSTSPAAVASVTASATCKPESRKNLEPTKTAIQISDADRKRKILITDKCTMDGLQEMAGKRRVFPGGSVPVH